MPLVSVIMNCYNSAQFLREALDSIYSQTFIDYEIIFWDNLSTDDSAQIAKSYGEPLRYFRGDQFLSLGAARNEAIARAKGKYITFLDCDDVWVPDKLEKQVQCFRENPEVDFIYSNFVKFEGNRNSPTPPPVLSGLQPEGDVFERFMHQYPVGLLTVMVTADSLKELDHLFDEKLSLAEEYDVFMRLLYRKKAAYVPEVLAYYRIHPNMTTITLRRGWPAEKAYVLDKFKMLSDDFEVTYKDALQQIILQLEYAKAKTYLIDGELIHARRHMKNCKYVSSKHYLLYLASYMPASLWMALKPLWARKTFR